MKPRFTRKMCSLALACTACFAAAPAPANPTTPAVVNGSAGFAQSGNTLNITNSPGTIINWNGFSIGSGEVTRFVQQSAVSSVLNRVTGSEASSLLGSLLSNGKVFLINPNGIVFGGGATIDVGGLVASSLSLSNADFLGGHYNFVATPGAGGISNQGRISTAQGGSVYLVAPDVRNSGVITAPGGEVILAAGSSVQLVDPASPSLRVELTAPDNAALNLGQIIADAGRIGIYAGAIINEGSVRADSAVLGENGHIVFKATKNISLAAGSSVSANGPQGGSVTLQAGDTTLVSGSIDVRGTAGPGGNVDVLGNLVGLSDGARIDASGQTAGGTILVGGDWQGANTAVQNAWRTTVAAGAQIRADALGSGDGGKVVVWSDDITRYQSFVSARGGAGSGNGGNVEVSGKRLLDFNGRVDLTAPNGSGGTLLLDPLNLTLSTGAGANTTGFTPVTDQTEAFADDAGLNSNFNISAGGSFAGVTAGSTLVLQASNQISVNNAFALATATGSANVRLTLNAATVNLNGAITTDGTGVLSGSATTVNVGAAGRIQNGVDVAAAGATVNVAAGTFTEQVVIAKNLTLSGSGVGATVVKSPAGLTTAPGAVQNNFPATASYAAVVYAHNATTINIRNLTVDGNYQAPFPYPPNLVGIGYYNAGGTVDNVLVTQVDYAVHPSNSFGGRAMYVSADSGTYAFTLSNSTISKFNRAALQFFTGGTGVIDINVLNNSILGDGTRLAGTAVQNGIQLQGAGVGGTISGNTISNLTYYDPTVAQAGAILQFGSARNLSVDANNFSNNDIHLYVNGSIAGTTSVTRNTFTGGQYDVVTDSATIITNNFMNGATSAAVSVSGNASQVTVNYNSILPAAGAAGSTPDANAAPGVENTAPASGVVDARYNWWGTPDLTQIGTKVSNQAGYAKVDYSTPVLYAGDRVPSAVGYQPYCTQPGCIPITPPAAPAATQATTPASTSGAQLPGPLNAVLATTSDNSYNATKDCPAPPAAAGESQSLAFHSSTAAALPFGTSGTNGPGGLGCADPAPQTPVEVDPSVR